MVILMRTSLPSPFHCELCIGAARPLTSPNRWIQTAPKGTVEGKIARLFGWNTLFINGTPATGMEMEHSPDKEWKGRKKGNQENEEATLTSLSWSSHGKASDWSSQRSDQTSHSYLHFKMLLFVSRVFLLEFTRILLELENDPFFCRVGYKNLFVLIL